MFEEQKPFILTEISFCDRNDSKSKGYNDSKSKGY